MRERSSQAVETCLIYCLCTALMSTAKKRWCFHLVFSSLGKSNRLKRPQMGLDRVAIERALVQLGLLVQHVSARLCFPACRGISARADPVRL